MRNLLSKLLIFILLVVCAVGTTPVLAQKNGGSTSDADWPEGPDVFAQTAVLIDASTGTVLYDKKKDKKMYPASITKIMTALLTVENCDLNDTVTFSAGAVNALNYLEDANIGCQPGEKMSVKDCLYALMLSSANEVATALGEHVAGNLNNFVAMMNDRAKQAGAKNTHFANANGLHDENHYVTAYDMAMIMRAASQYDVFNQIINTVSYTIPKNNKRKEAFIAQQRHKMVSPYNAVYYEGIIGGKTGYTDQSGTTLVTMAERKGLRLICVVLHSNAQYVYSDTSSLLDFGFSHFQKLNVAENTDGFGTADEGLQSPFSDTVTSVSFDKDSVVIVPKNTAFSKLSASVSFAQEKDSFATVTYTLGTHTVGTAKVTYRTTALAERDKQTTTETASASVRKPKKSFHIPKSLIIIICIIIVIAVILILIIRHQKKINRIRAQKRRRNR